MTLSDARQRRELKERIEKFRDADMDFYSIPVHQALSLLSELDEAEKKIEAVKTICNETKTTYYTDIYGIEHKTLRHPMLMRGKVLAILDGR